MRYQLRNVMTRQAAHVAVQPILNGLGNKIVMLPTNNSKTTAMSRRRVVRRA
jgi:hypothetical protein